MWLAGAFLVFATWSYNSPVVRFEEVRLEQLPSDKADFLRFRMFKSVHWYRWCHGVSHQSLTHLTEETAPRGGSVSIPLESHPINVPPKIGAYSGYRPNDLYVQQALMPPGKYVYNVCSMMTCWPWEELRPIESDCAQSTFSVTK